MNTNETTIANRRRILALAVLAVIGAAVLLYFFEKHRAEQHFKRTFAVLCDESNPDRQKAADVLLRQFVDGRLWWQRHSQLGGYFSTVKPRVQEPVSEASRNITVVLAIAGGPSRTVDVADVSDRYEVRLQVALWIEDQPSIRCEIQPCTFPLGTGMIHEVVMDRPSVGEHRVLVQWQSQIIDTVSGKRLYRGQRRWFDAFQVIPQHHTAPSTGGAAARE